MLALDDVESADARADKDADALAVLGRDLQAGAFDGFMRGGESEMDEARHFARFFLVNELERVEVLHLGGEGDGEAGGVKAGDGGDAALTGQQVVPDFGGGVADGRNQAESGDNDASLQDYLPPFAFLSM